MNNFKLIEKAKEAALKGQILDRETIVALLSIEPESKAADTLGETAHLIAKEVTGNHAKVWSSIGIDYEPCEMNCRFCSFGEKWNALKEHYTWSDQEVLDFSAKFVKEGAAWITLRTTEFYGLEKLCRLAKRIKTQIPGSYKLVANTGELDNQTIGKLTEAGVEVIYHSIRLREGIDTPFHIEERAATLETIKNSPLDLAYLVEPIGVEHSNEELADIFLTAMKYGAKLSGAMARIPVKGTPLFSYGQISERRLAQIVAVTRLAANFNAPDICIHPASQIALNWGANVVVVETGAIPRDETNLNSEWHSFTINTAKEWFKKANYNF